MNITVFKKSTGEILRYCTVPAGMANLQVSEGEDWIEGAFSDHAYYIDGVTPVEKPNKPSEFHTFDYTLKQWIDPRSLDEIRLQQKEKINQSRDLTYMSGFEWNGHVFDSDPISQQKISGAVQLALMADESWSITWTLKNNSDLTLTRAQMLDVGRALGAWVDSVHSKARELKRRVDFAQTKEEIDAIVWQTL